MRNFIYTTIVILFLFGCSENKTETKRPMRGTVTEQEPDKGKTVFEENCALCHGADGTAGIANAANLQSSEIQSTAILQIISEGKKSMPSFGQQLSNEDIKNVANYVETLRK